MKLLINALNKLLCGLLFVGLLIFLPAGTLHYTYGWLLIGLLFVPMLIAGFVMLARSPELLARRLDAKEKQGTQKCVVALSGLMFRDLIYQMRGMMRADHKFYKKQGIYDFPQKKKLTSLKMYLVGMLLSNEKVLAKMGSKMNEGMLAPYKKLFAQMDKEKM